MRMCDERRVEKRKSKICSFMRLYSGENRGWKFIEYTCTVHSPNWWLNVFVELVDGASTTPISDIILGKTRHTMKKYYSTFFTYLALLPQYRPLFDYKLVKCTYTRHIFKPNSLEKRNFKRKYLSLHFPLIFVSKTMFCLTIVRETTTFRLKL